VAQVLRQVVAYDGVKLDAVNVYTVSPVDRKVDNPAAVDDHLHALA
jgi:hypothetical protein